MAFWPRNGHFGSFLHILNVISTNKQHHEWWFRMYTCVWWSRTYTCEWWYRIYTCEWYCENDIVWMISYVRMWMISYIHVCKMISYIQVWMMISYLHVWVTTSYIHMYTFKWWYRIYTCEWRCHICTCEQAGSLLSRAQQLRQASIMHALSLGMQHLSWSVCVNSWVSIYKHNSNKINAQQLLQQFTPKNTAQSLVA